ncbi:hypothetical protein [Rhizobium sp. P28RR-XV]|uniref:hypothetical protein n=1 Tax=Rhizobium sp. P28RR-XV TaxID=2726737 RepID=UPI0014578171|nr:hypothetical protein [Rhizobium sp. P28RR-XV]NLR85606.1 hypothetical protein [Rhizobium sp. P28RR-XV]
MKHHALQEIRSVAKVNLEYPYPLPVARRDRLERWAQLLERCEDQALSTLHETEYQSAKERAIMRADNSPLSVAFADPVLRAAGLAGDSYGEIRQFFGLSHNQLHRLVCYCHFGATVNASAAAKNVRALIAAGDRPSIFARVRDMFRR